MRSAIHPCWHSLTILTPCDLLFPGLDWAEPTDKDKQTPNGGRSGLQYGPTVIGRDQPVHEHEITEEPAAGVTEGEVDNEMVLLVVVLDLVTHDEFTVWA